MIGHIRFPALVALGLIFASVTALADSCENKARDDSEMLDCAAQSAKKALAKIEPHYRGAIDAAKAAVTDCDTKVEFAPVIEDSQKRWKGWIDQECELEGDVIMGTAAGRATSVCLQQAARERIKKLDDITSTIRSWCPQSPPAKPSPE